MGPIGEAIGTDEPLNMVSPLSVKLIMNIPIKRCDLVEHGIELKATIVFQWGKNRALPPMTNCQITQVSVCAKFADLLSK